MKNILIAFIFTFFFNVSSAISENKYGLEVGWGYIPGLEDDAKSIGQELANSLGSTVTLETDTGAIVLRGFGQMPIDEKLTLEGGVFISGDVDTKFTYSGGSTTISQDVFGFDLSLLYEITDGILVKGGFHSSEVDGAASITLGSASASVTTSDSGTSGLIGIETADNSQWTFSLVYYEGLGGLDDSDLTLFSGKYTF